MLLLLGGQRDLLPGRVDDPGPSAAAVRAVGAGAGPGDHQSLGGELGQGARDGDRADPEALDESPAGRQLLTRRVALQLAAEAFGETLGTATMFHENTE